MKVLILNGPNLNMLGTREPEIYGDKTLYDIETLCEQKGRELGIDIDFRQSNHEGELVTWTQEAARSAKDRIFDGLIINAAAYSHTSVALHDALKMLEVPVIEVHISNPKEREPFRHISYIEPAASAVIAGHGPEGYVMAVERMAELLKT